MYKTYYLHLISWY